MKLQPVPDVPALRMDDALIIGDLHIGVESHLVSRGFHLSSRTDDMFDRIVAAAGTDIRRIIMIGDIKDSVPGSTRQEYREIPQFCDSLLEHFDEVDIVRGNHDTSLEEFVPGQVRIFPASGMIVGDIGLIHGHTWPSNEVMRTKTLVMGHEHPTVKFADRVGAHMTEPCWLRGRFNPLQPGGRYDQLPERFIVEPAFNHLLGGSPINIIGQPLLGPLLNSELVDLDGAEIFLLDGIDLGRRANLLVKDRNYLDRWDDREDTPKHNRL